MHSVHIVVLFLFIVVDGYLDGISSYRPFEALGRSFGFADRCVVCRERGGTRYPPKESFDLFTMSSQDHHRSRQYLHLHHQNKNKSSATFAYQHTRTSYVHSAPTSTSHCFHILANVFSDNTSAAVDRFAQRSQHSPPLPTPTILSSSVVASHNPVAAPSSTGMQMAVQAFSAQKKGSLYQACVGVLSKIGVEV